MKFIYPTASINLDDNNSQIKMRIGSFGNFPLTAFNAWHGGCHIGGDEEPIQAVADGRIIAFRMTKGYETEVYDFDALPSEDEAFRKQKYKRQYSRAFILVQHDYKSPIGQQLRYYSLYHHIMPVDYMIGKDPRTEEEKQQEKKAAQKREQEEKERQEEARKQQLEADKKNPPKYKVTAQEGKVIQGIWARQPRVNGTRKKPAVGYYLNEQKIVVPYGDTVKRVDKKDESIVVRDGYYRIQYKGAIYYMRATATEVEDLGNDTYKILSKRDRDPKEDKTVIGARVREEANGKSTLLYIISTNTEIEIDVEGGNKNWKKLKDGSGYIYSGSLVRIPTKADKEAQAKAAKEQRAIAAQQPKKQTLPTQKELPDFLSKKAYKVKAQDGIPLDPIEEGWWIRQPYDQKVGYDDSEYPKNKERKRILPKGTIVAKAPLENDTVDLGSEKYKRIAYKGDFYYMHTSSSAVIDLGAEGYQIDSDKDKRRQDKSILGARVYQTPDTSAPILKIIPFDTLVEIDERVQGNWKKLKHEEGYVQAASLSYTKSYDEDEYPYDQVHACDYPVKAGELLGYTGKFGYKGSEFANLTHFEIFTDDEEQLSNFLTNAATGKEGEKDGTDQLRYTLVKGATLTTNLTKNVSIKAKTPVKVLVRKGKYAKVKVVSIQKIVVKDADVYYKGTKTTRPSGKGHSSSPSYYHIHDAFISSVSTTFDQKFDKNTVLFFDGYVTEDGEENTNDYRRKARYYPEYYNQEFWIDREALEKDASPHDAPGADVFNMKLTTSFDTQLKTNVNTVYIVEPQPEPEEPITLTKDKKLTDKKLKEVKDGNDEIWYYIAITETDSATEKPIEKKGWIKKTDPKLQQRNPFHWGSYGFSLLDAGEDYIYSVANYNEQKNTSPFIKTLWSALDIGVGEEKKGKSDGKITKQEIDHAYRNPEIADQLSKYICKHKSEWSYTPATIKHEVEKFLEVQIQKEQKKDLSDEAKKLLEDKKKFILEKLTEKAKNLMWWDEVKNATYTPKPTPEVALTGQAKADARYLLPKEEVPQIESPQSHSAIRLSDGKPFEQPTTKSVAETPTVASTTAVVDTAVVDNEMVDTIPVETPETTPTIEEKKPERTLPSTDKVWHFHPLAFIKHMRVMYGNTGNCLCSRELEVEEVRKIVKRLKGKDKLWGGIGETCDIEDKSFETFTKELNKMFKKYGFNTCIAKLSFLAQAAHETGGFQQSKEEKSNYKSSQSTFKGRGLIQITGNKDDTGYYNEAGLYEEYANLVGNPSIISDPDIISKNIHYAIDASGWYFARKKKVPTWNSQWRSHDEKRKEKKIYFKDGLGKTLLGLAKFINDDPKYFWLQSKIIHGYPKSHTLNDNPYGWEDRISSLMKLKSIFKLSTECAENLNVINTEDRASWMKIAIEEAEKSAGCHEGKEPLLSMGTSYLRFAGNSKSPDDDVDGQWCASYMSWCIDKAKFKVPSEKWRRANSQQFRLNSDIYKKIDNPIFGAIAVYTKYADSSRGHVGFVAGKTKSGKLILLGGNQKDTIRGTEFNKTSSTKFFNGFYIPKDYNVTEKDNLTEEEINYSDSSEFNYKIGVYTKKKDDSDKTS